MSQILEPPKKVFEFHCRGIHSPMGMWEVIQKLICLVGMTPARKGRIDRYPWRGGGGSGFTIYQPLVESFCTADVYYNSKLTYIVLSTCKPERVDLVAVHGFLSEQIGRVFEPDPKEELSDRLKAVHHGSDT